MSRTYTKKPDSKQPKMMQKEQRDKRIVLADYEIEFIEMSLGPTIRLRSY